jgi:hypothetical protein
MELGRNKDLEAATANALDKYRIAYLFGLGAFLIPGVTLLLISETASDKLFIFALI